MSDFVEKLLLLLVAAGTTGLLVPLILKNVDERRRLELIAGEKERLRAQKMFEADLASIRRWAGCEVMRVSA